MPDAAFQITTRLGAPADRVWVWALTEEGINFELRPWLRMTHPKGLTHARAIDQAPLGEPLGRSWILLRGLVPVDYDDLCLAERGPGLRFLEISELGSARRWQHEREVIPLDGDACEITDRLELDLRAPLRVMGASRIAGRIVRTLFTHRHRRLLERWGMPPGRKSPDPRTTPNGSWWAEIRRSVPDCPVDYSWASTLITTPCGSRTKKRRTPHGSSTGP